MGVDLSIVLNAIGKNIILERIEVKAWRSIVFLGMNLALKSIL